MKYQLGLPREAHKDEPVALDIEVFGQQEPFHIPTGEFACLTVVFDGAERYLIPDRQDLKETLQRLKKGLWTMHNATYDISQLRRWVSVPERPIFDTMLMEQALYGGYYDSFSLDAVSRRRLGKGLKKGVREKFATATKMTKEMEQYSIADSEATLRILYSQIANDDAMNAKWYWDIDGPMIWVLLDMLPQKVNVPRWHKLADEFSELGMAIEADLGFNVYSPKVTKDKINEVIAPRKIKSTNAKTVLEPLVEELKGEQREFIEAILRARMYRKASNTYGHLWPERWADHRGLVRSGWRITGTETGRMASRKPNLQNIPSRRLPVYRELFVSQFQRGRILVSDIAQQEVRILAHMSQDRNLKKAFEEDVDVHMRVKELIGPACKDRSQAKDLNFGMSYGMTYKGLAKRTGLKLFEAKQLLKQYFRTVPGVQQYITRMRQIGLRDEKVHTAYGRPVWLNTYLWQWKNNAINGPIQGSGGDHIKLAQVKLREYCKSEGVYFPLTMPIHDELVCDIKPGFTKQVRKLVTDAWMDAGKQIIPDVPMKVDIAVGSNWGVK